MAMFPVRGLQTESNAPKLKNRTRIFPPHCDEQVKECEPLVFLSDSLMGSLFPSKRFSTMT